MKWNFPAGNYLAAFQGIHKNYSSLWQEVTLGGNIIGQWIWSSVPSNYGPVEGLPGTAFAGFDSFQSQHSHLVFMRTFAFDPHSLYSSGPQGSGLCPVFFSACVLALGLIVFSTVAYIFTAMQMLLWSAWLYCLLITTMQSQLWLIAFEAFPLQRVRNCIKLYPWLKKREALVGLLPTKSMYR